MTAKQNTVKVRRTTDTNAITFTLGASGTAVQFFKFLATASNDMDAVKKLNSITGIKNIDVWGYNTGNKCYIVPVSIKFTYRENGLDMAESRELAKLKDMFDMANNVAKATNADLDIILASMNIDTERMGALVDKRNAEGDKTELFIPVQNINECCELMLEFIDENGDKVLGKL